MVISWSGRSGPRATRARCRPPRMACRRLQRCWVQRRVGFGFCGAGPVSTCKLHVFVLVRVIACLLSFYLFRLAARNGPNHCIGPKNRRHCLFVFLFLCLLVCLFVWSLVCLCVLFFPLFFLVSLLFDDRCSDKCQNLDEGFHENREFYKF